jgi:branched-chain amino acid transport system substrate-binding protein
MSMSRRTLVLLAAGLCLPGCSGSAPPAPVFVGHVATRSGPDRYAGEMAAQGIRLAVAEANKSPEQGAGRPVKVIHTDTLGKLEAFEAEAVRLVSVSRVVALLGGTTAEEVGQLEKARVLVVSPCGTLPRSRNDMVFVTGLSPARQGRLLARFVVEKLQATRAAVLADGAQDSSVNLAEEFARAFQAAAAKKGPKAPGVRPPVLRYGKELKLPELAKRIQEDKPAVVLLAGSLTDLGQLRRELGAKAPPLLFGGDDGSLKAVQEAGGKGAVYLMTAFVTDADVPRAQEFAKKYREAFKEEPDVHAALAYDDARLLFEALRRTQDNLTGANLRDKMAGLKDFPGLTGPLSFAGERQLRRPAFVVRAEGGQAKTEQRYGPDE